MSQKLLNIVIPDTVHCENVHCSHAHHQETYSMSVLEAVDNAAGECLPKIGGNKSDKNKNNSLFGWNTYVKDYQLESKFWGAVHKSAGSPNTGALYDIVRHTKMQYHHAVRRLRRATNKLQNYQFCKAWQITILIVVFLLGCVNVVCTFVGVCTCTDLMCFLR